MYCSMKLEAAGTEGAAVAAIWAATVAAVVTVAVAVTVVVPLATVVAEMAQGAAVAA